MNDAGYVRLDGFLPPRDVAAVRPAVEDVRAHLIQHLSLPQADETVPAGGWQAELLPRFDGRPSDLALSWEAPPAFAVR